MPVLKLRHSSDLITSIGKKIAMVQFIFPQRKPG